MKFLSYVFIVLLTLSYPISTFAEEAEKESLYSQIDRAVIRLEHFDLVTQKTDVGTAFFVVSNGKLFVVSARHVVEHPFDFQARVQTKNQKTGEDKVFILKLPKDKWIFHANMGDKETSYVDVAVMRIFTPTDWGIVNFAYEPDYSPNEKENQLPDKDAEPPRPILVFGFPSDVGFYLLEQHPLARSGIISMRTGKRFIKLQDGKYAEDRACLIDARIFGGNSGSPVMNEPRLTDSEPRLLGLVTAANSSLDFAIMEPVSRIREAIDQAINSEGQGSWEETRQ